MATLVLGTIGTVVGGPLGGAIGSLLGRSIDGELSKGPDREGPRLTELTVSTSSYGRPIAQVHGTMRLGGTIMWSTDLVEHSEREGGGKGKPGTVSHSYSASFAVALSSRPIARLGRVWADGNLLRGAAGDLKTGGTLRVHTGTPDQQPDPAIVADKGTHSPAFRGLGYVVFEDLELADFGDRIPALSFEIVGNDGNVSLVELAGGLADTPAGSSGTLPGFSGYALEAPPIAALDAIARVVPLDCHSAGGRLALGVSGSDQPVELTEPAIAEGEDRFGGITGRSRKRARTDAAPPSAIRYYDPARDYQPGQQRHTGPVPDGQPTMIELPAAMSAATARSLIGATALRRRASRETVLWRDAALDAQLQPGMSVRLPQEAGTWRITGWEWRAEGVELELERLAATRAVDVAADAGANLPLPDLLLPPTRIRAFELPWDGYGDAAAPAIRAALSAPNEAWTGAALYAVEPDGGLRPIGPAGRTRAITGTIEAALGEGSPFHFDRTNQIEVQLLDPAFTLASSTPERLAFGDNRALVGEEIVQFSDAEDLGGGRYALTGLLRGRGGTEHRIAGHAAGESFVLLDGRSAAVDPAKLAGAGDLAAIGHADNAPATSPIANKGIATRPLCPVHPRVEIQADGALAWRWTRRARGAWAWRDEVDVALAEEAERYDIGFGRPDAVVARWQTDAPAFGLAADTLAALVTAHPDGCFFVRQRGDHGLSLPILLPLG
ncbi:phage tail protein [Pseudoblastomonas halimionae]|uniref:Uncharacterized protein n=1 Tax=Alteriqipengyuania halimionae TaxID=1926630 RepID=A0A6I4U6H7_9SPHN|nr:phage tail protein [Alteriqipengyuania halimionae]MXP11014.1 hypothetical protein [Alteriqipengyuania halimionae]